MTTYGATDADTDASGLGRQRLRITDPSGITTIQATVRVTTVTTQGCPANPTPTVSSAGIVGTFFNDGTVGEPSRNGDILAVFVKSKSSSAGNRIEAFVHRCNSSGCFGPSTVVASHVFATTWTTAQTHTLRMEWDEASDLFRFTVNPGGPGEEIATLPYASSDSTPLVGIDFKELRVENIVADCTAAQKRGNITGRFDDVMLIP